MNKIPAGIKAFIFDMDGTLADTEMIYAAALMNTFEKKSVPISIKQAVSLVYGRSWQSIYLDLEKMEKNIIC